MRRENRALRADLATQKLVALRKEVEEKLTHSEFARADSAADNARHVARIDAFREVLALIDAS
jgi:hypothetical protein